MIEEIAEIINNHTYVVDEWLLNRLDEEFAKGSYSNRENINALALELTAKREGKIKTGDIATNPKTGKKETYQWRHDWKYDENIFIDLKRKPMARSNICLTGVSKMIESYNMKELTHIVAFSQNIENNYKIGQKLYFKFEGILPLKQAINESTSMDTFKLLNVNNLQKLKLGV
jgi:hypothetical protein